MQRTVSVTEAKTQFTQLLAWAHTNTSQVIVEKHGDPTAVIVSIQEYAKLKKLQQKVSREIALQQLELLAKENRNRNSDLHEADAVHIANELSKLTIKGLEKRGKTKFSK